jgi:hypothetical protein
MLQDDFGFIVNYSPDYENIKKNFQSITHDTFDVSKIKALMAQCSFGINPFDMWTLKNYVANRNIKVVTELGCGSTTYFLRLLDVECRSFALEDAIHSNVGFFKCDIFQSADKILESCATSDMLLIDSLHHYEMAKFYHNNILSKINLPVFMHDWFDDGDRAYSEQKYWLENILNKDYELFLMTRIYDKCPIEKHWPVPTPCSAIFHKTAAKDDLTND